MFDDHHIFTVKPPIAAFLSGPRPGELGSGVGSGRDSDAVDSPVTQSDIAFLESESNGELNPPFPSRRNRCIAKVPDWLD